MNAQKRRAIYETLQSLNPHPTTELEYTTPFELLIAVMLSAQATDVSVNKAMRKMFPVANTPQALLELGESERPVIQCRRETEAIVNQHFFAGSIPKVHSLDLRNGDVGLVDDEQKVVREVVE